MLLLLSVFTYLAHAFWFNVGANVWQWVTSFVALAGWSGMFWQYWHNRCYICWRPGRVPVKDTVHHVCKSHAIEHGHVH